MTQQTIHDMLHGTPEVRLETQADDAATPSPEESPRQKLFQELQKASEENKAARQRAVDHSKTTIDP